MSRQPGERVDHYTILHKVGHGGMSEVYRAKDDRDGHEVVLKFPHDDVAGDPAGYERLCREIKIGEMLTHPHIQKLYGLFGGEADTYLVLEYVPGTTLRDTLRKEKALSIERTIDFGKQLAEALAYAHAQHVFHRDLKPENVIVDATGCAKVMDFGIAFVEGARRITWGKLSSEVGTPDYMAPEQIKGQRGDARTDIYALGMMLYECLAGRLPYAGDNALSIMNQHVTVSAPPLHRFLSTVPGPIEEIVMKAIRRQADQRWSSMDALLLALSHPDQVDANALQRERDAEEQSNGGPTSEFGMPLWKVGLVAVGVLGALTALVFLIQMLHGGKP